MVGGSVVQRCRECKTHLERLLSHVGGRDEGRHGNAVMTFHVAVDAGQIKKDGGEAEAEEEKEQAERGQDLAADGQVAEPGGRAVMYGVPYHRVGVVATRCAIPQSSVKAGTR